MAIAKFHCVLPDGKKRICGIEEYQGTGLWKGDFVIAYQFSSRLRSLCPNCINKLIENGELAKKVY
jgi:hypothetical protein